MNNDESNETFSSTGSRSAGLIDWLRRTRPISIKILMVLVGLEALAVSVYTVWGVINLVTGNASHFSVAIMLLLCTAAASWFLWVLLRGIGNGNTWVRGPLVTVQIFIILVGISTVQSTMWWAGLILITYGLGTLVALFSKRSTAFIGVRDLPQS